MAARKAEPLVKSLCIDAGMMRQQFDHPASLGPRFGNRPLHHLLTDAAAAAVFGDADILDQAARGACELNPGRMQSCRQPTTTPFPSSATIS